MLDKLYVKNRKYLYRIVFLSGELKKKTLLTEWFHIKEIENPVDIILHGCCPTELAYYTFW